MKHPWEFKNRYIEITPSDIEIEQAKKAYNEFLEKKEEIMEFLDKNSDVSPVQPHSVEMSVVIEETAKPEIQKEEDSASQEK